MKALLTGATGFLGGRLAERLLGLGWEVTALGRNATLGGLLQTKGARFMQVDLQDQEAVMAACSGQEVVFHSGALSSPWGKYADFYSTNVEGTKHVIAGCFQHGVQRLIHISTPSVYFDFQDRLNITESAPLPTKFANAYAATKRLAELEVEQACNRGLSAAILRPRAIFGPGDSSILPRLIRANASRGVPLIDGGLAWIDLTYVDNVVDALLLCCQAPSDAMGRIYNISNGEPVQLATMLPLLFSELGVPMRIKRLSYQVAYQLAAVMELIANLRPSKPEPLLTRYSVGVLGRSQTLDISAAKQAFGYAPQISVWAGLQAFAQYWRSRQ
ncbi:NAD-dependent epimerase/dehydratase family protein [Paenibacillus agricola]|uniref:NAD(P)-dependent oxidoreductase n=1 Tax=Paenibacillus agricola TaxID=2716264 RepID=A0ABX0J181_9BACL|nr:NAD(P)-dependent oxidoreductase [Paenibacillus agricola]NHN28647.1 NAD(P)-dependent oxidoreductase [Paenibacillus agricola]